MCVNMPYLHMHSHVTWVFVEVKGGCPISGTEIISICELLVTELRVLEMSLGPVEEFSITGHLSRLLTF